MKTATQLLIDELKAKGFELYGMAEYLELEKQQLIDAFSFGRSALPKTAEEYFNETFANNSTKRL